MHDSRPMNKIWGDEKAFLLLSWMRKDDSILMLEFGSSFSLVGMSPCGQIYRHTSFNRELKRSWLFWLPTR